MFNKIHVYRLFSIWIKININIPYNKKVKKHRMTVKR